MVNENVEKEREKEDEEKKNKKERGHILDVDLQLFPPLRIQV